MQLIAPDILKEAQEFSLAVSAPAFGLGLLLWIFGWRGHRFWIVLITTIGAGVLGLYIGPAYGARPIVGGILLACAAGALALSLVRVIAFSAGGAAAWLLMRTIAPTVEEPLICFLIGGLIGLFLFRVWTMALTSSAGAFLMVYSGLCLAHALGNVDAVAWAENQTMLFNCLCGGLALVGIVVQLVLDRQRQRQQRRRTHRGSSASSQTYHGSPWWSWGQSSYRRAG